MTRTIGLNDVATVQYKKCKRHLYTIVIEDSKEELAIDIFMHQFKSFKKNLKQILSKTKKKEQVVNQ
jgi:hypothetical protein